MSKYERETRESVLVVGTGAAILGGYLGAEMLLRGQGHGWHWLATVMIALASYAALRIWQLVRRS